MTMPKKGTRKIVVNDTVYKYMIKPYRGWAGVRGRIGGNVTIEMPDGAYISKDIEGSVTPSIVRSIIEEN